VLGWIDPVVAAAEHCHGASRERGLVGDGVYASCQAGHDDEACFRQIACEALRHLQAGGRGIPRTDDGNARCAERFRIPSDSNERRRAVYGREIAGIVPFAGRDEAHTLATCGVHFALDIRERSHLDRSAPAATREIRQGIQRRACTTEMVDQAAKGSGPDTLATNKPQPLEPLLVV
jgi:hypothetical protein